MSDLGKTWLRWSVLTLCGLGVIGAAVGLVVFLGAFDASAETGWSQVSAYVIHHTMIHSVRARSGADMPPQPFTAAEVEAGFRLYDAHCAMCHGGPGLARQPWTGGMEPTPPYLIDSAEHWAPSDLYWIVAHGVKMTGMPAWNARLSSAEMWNVVAFLEALPKLSPADYARLRAATPQGPPRPTQPAPFGPIPPPHG